MTGVSEEILSQMRIFAQGAAAGAAMTALYDVIRIFRRIRRHGIVWLSMEDVLYWITFAIMEFALLYRVNSGIPRMYIFLGSAIGAAGYHFALGRYLVKAASRLIRSVKKRLKKAHKEGTINKTGMHGRETEDEQNPKTQKP